MWKFLLLELRGSGLGLTNSLGEFSITNLASGTYTVISSKEGFKSNTSSININSGGAVETLTVELLPNNGRISGVVTDPNGEVLPFRVMVIASTNDISITTQTNAQGEFTFEGIETGLSYTLVTDIYRDGYENVETNLVVPLGEDETFLPENFEVIVRKSSISGNAGVSGATLSLLDSSTDQIIELATSATDGSFLFDFLRQGSYKVQAQRQGFIFTPSVSQVLTLGIEGSETISFTAQGNIATLDVRVTNASDNGEPDVDVTIISADKLIVLTAKTGVNGIARFSKIQASTEYTVRPAKEGFTVSPQVKVITLNSGDSTSTGFSLLPNNSSLTGNVKTSSSSNIKECYRNGCV